MLRPVILACLLSLGGCSFAFGGPKAMSPREGIGMAVVDGALATAAFAAVTTMSCRPDEFLCANKVVAPTTAVIGAVLAASAVYGLVTRPSAAPPPPARPWNPDDDVRGQFKLPTSAPVGLADDAEHAPAQGHREVQ